MPDAPRRGNQAHRYSCSLWGQSSWFAALRLRRAYTRVCSGVSGPQRQACLTLNIWRPSPAPHNSSAANDSAAPAAAAKLPVMVYMFGGGLCGGFAGNRYFNGSNYAIVHNVIVVTVS